MNHHDAANEIVGAAVRDNIVATFILNYLEELDKQLEEPCIKVMRLNAKMNRYWLEASERMGSDCLQDLCSILRLQLSPEEEQLVRSLNMMSNIGATQFFQSTADRMPRQPGEVRHGDHLGAAAPDPLSLSVSQRYPGLGMTAGEYEVPSRHSRTSRSSACSKARSASTSKTRTARCSTSSRK